MFYFIWGYMMSFEKNVRENMMKNSVTAGMLEQKIEPVYGLADRLYRLIEKDEGVPFHLIFGDKPDEGSYLFIGEGIRKLTGLEAGNFTERKLFDMIEETVPLSENIPADRRMLKKLISLGEIREYRIEMRLKTKAGEKWIRETAVQYSESGTITGLMGIYHDITEEKNSCDLLQEAIKKASESERLKNSFLQNISHEVRTPLNAIVGFSTLLSEPGLDYGKKEEFTRMINTSTDDLLCIMENIIEISRIEAGSENVTISDVKPSSVLKRIHSSFHDRALENNIIFDCTVPADSDLSIRTDESKLFQIIYNLAGNALKFTDAGKVEIGCRQLDSHLEFFVSDTGIGISEQDKSKIFNKFFQADSGSTRRFNGAGLGLTISKAYAGMLGGSLDVESEKGRGSIFRFILPY